MIVGGEIKEVKPSAGYHLISSEQVSLSQLGVSLGLLAAQLRLVVEEVREESRRLGPAGRASSWTWAATRPSQRGGTG